MEGDTEMMILLPDNSQVIINPGSKIVYPARFLENRSVRLEGQAMFKVAKLMTEEGERAPFVVTTEMLACHVLGTDFFISEPEGDGRTMVSLYNGNVEVEAGGVVSGMERGEQYEYDHKSGEAAISLIPVDEMIKNGYKPRLKFNDATLREIIEAIEVVYEV